jgi:hypothetical protein
MNVVADTDPFSRKVYVHILLKHRELLGLKLPMDMFEGSDREATLQELTKVVLKYADQIRTELFCIRAQLPPVKLVNYITNDERRTTTVEVICRNGFTVTDEFDFGPDSDFSDLRAKVIMVYDLLP